MSSPSDPRHATRAQRSQLACFSYLNAPNAALYVDVLAVFARAREEFQLNLRAADVRARLESGVSEEELAGALDQLGHWGNLEAFHDNSAGRTFGFPFIARTKRNLFSLRRREQAHDWLERVRRRIERVQAVAGQSSSDVFGTPLDAVRDDSRSGERSWLPFSLANSSGPADGEVSPRP